MLVVGGAIVLGLLVGLASGGSLRRLGERGFRWWPLAVVGFVLQALPVPAVLGSLQHAAAYGLLVASYALLLAFVAVNIRAAGFAILAVGFALNAIVIVANGGMPVSAQALRGAAGSTYAQQVRVLDATGGAKHHLAGPDTRLLPLADVIGVGRPVDAVFSVGDLFWLVGAAWAVAAATRAPRYLGRHRARARAVVAIGGSPPAVRPTAWEGSGLRPAPDPDRDPRDDPPRPWSPAETWAAGPLPSHRG